VRRFLGDALGPSDFRKNAHRLAGELNTCPNELLEILDFRIPDDSQGLMVLRVLRGEAVGEENGPGRHIQSLVSRLPRTAGIRLAALLAHFEREFTESGRGFNFSDCSIGNLVFAGCYLAEQRDFNRSVAAYSALVGLGDDLIENVTDGGNA